MIEKITPAGAVRAYCTYCLGMVQFNRSEVADCQGDLDPNGPCAFYPYRLGKRPPVKVFRQFCLACMIGDREAVACCETETCVCHPYRFGKNPARRGMGGNREALEKARELKNKRLESTIGGRHDASFV